MFLCVSPNPAIDKRLTLTVLERARVNRARAVQNFPGGKSTHVAMVLRTLGGSPRWIGPCGGASGQALTALPRGIALESPGLPALDNFVDFLLSLVRYFPRIR